jgi:hypothetical protein
MIHFVSILIVEKEYFLRKSKIQKKKGDGVIPFLTYLKKIGTLLMFS